MEKMLAAQDARLVALRPRQVALAPRERLPWRLPSRPPSEGNAKATHPPFSRQNRPKGPENPHFQAACDRDGNCSGHSDGLAHAVIGSGAPWSVRRMASMARIARRLAVSTTDRISA